jgi:hypothetical protein
MAGIIDAATWALRSPHGAYLSNWLKPKRGVDRFHGETAMFYMLYTRSLTTEPRTPPLSFLAGGRPSGHFIARSGWGDGETIVALSCTDHFGDHHHYDQGGLVIYRNGLLAVDPPVYRRIRGPQQRTENHNTLLLGGRPQRPVRGQWFVTVEDFRKNLKSGRELETGDFLFHAEADGWAAAACQFAQAYDPEQVESCVRQLLLVRPDTVLVVDHLAGPAGRSLPEVQWLLHLPAAPTLAGAGLWASHGKSWLRCRPLLPGGRAPTVAATDVKTHRASYAYDGGRTLTLVHLLEVGDGAEPDRSAGEIEVEQTDDAVVAAIGGRSFTFASRPPFHVTSP